MDGQILSGLFRSAVVIPVITLFLGFSLGFYTTSIFPVNIPTSSSQKEFTLSSALPKPAMDTSKLPISLSLLTNPIVYEWRGSVKGKLTKKDEHTFTLVDDKGNNITITDITPSGAKWKTMFFEQISQKKQQESSLSAIPIGSTLLGDFFIFKGSPNTAVGGLFVKQ